MIINNIKDFESYIGVEADCINGALYDATACGAWFNYDDKGIDVGSIVEGSDAEFSRRFDFPFETGSYETWIEELEDLCNHAWLEANGDLFIIYNDIDYELAMSLMNEKQIDYIQVGNIHDLYLVTDDPDAVELLLNENGIQYDCADINEVVY